MYFEAGPASLSRAIVLSIVVIGVVLHTARPQTPGSPVDTYVDSSLCAQCHSNQARTYRLTGMGRSFHRPQPGDLIKDHSRGGSYYHEASETHFAMIRRGGRYYQRRYQIGYQGKEINVEEKQIDLVTGSEITPAPICT